MLFCYIGIVRYVTICKPLFLKIKALNTMFFTIFFKIPSLSVMNGDFFPHKDDSVPSIHGCEAKLLHFIELERRVILPFPHYCHGAGVNKSTSFLWFGHSGVWECFVNVWHVLDFGTPSSTRMGKTAQTASTAGNVSHLQRRGNKHLK